MSINWNILVQKKYSEQFLVMLTVSGLYLLYFKTDCEIMSQYLHYSNVKNKNYYYCKQTARQKPNFVILYRWHDPDLIFDHPDVVHFKPIDLNVCRLPYSGIQRYKHKHEYSIQAYAKNINFIFFAHPCTLDQYLWLHHCIK